MDVVSLCPLPASSLIWRPSPTRWSLSILCKATFQLEPGSSALAAEQEPINERDNHWDDDPLRSVYAPSDLVPFKPRADLVLVGSAYARSGQPVRSLVARMSLGSVDKAIEVFCPRVRTRDGELREGKRWATMPLLYERAGGGPETENPVGIGRSTPRDLYGQVQLPNLQRPGSADGAIEPIGFGPIAASWPSRRRRAGRDATDEELCRAPFGEGFDPDYFQAAPRDQQIDLIRPGETILLENLHPRHPRLTTTLLDRRPGALVELGGAEAKELTLIPDTLWIDTHRSLCTLTFRASVDLRAPEQEGRILVSMGIGDQPIPWAQIAPPRSPPRPAPPSLPEIDASDLLESIEITQIEEPERALLDTSVLDPSADPAALPFVPAPPGWKPPSVITFGPPPRSSAQAGPHVSTQKIDMTGFRTALPPWFDAGAPAPPPPDAPSFGAPALLAPEALAPALVAPIAVSLPATSSMAAPSMANPQAAPPRPALLPSSSPGNGESVALGVLAASNAAAGELAPAAASQTPEQAPAASPGAQVIVELLWSEPLLGARLAREPRFLRFRSSPPAKPSPPAEAPAADPGKEADIERALIHRIMTRAAPSTGREGEAALDAADEESPPSPPLLLFGGDLELCFDETERLEAMVSAARPLAGTDKKLNEMLELFAGMAKTPLLGMPEVAQGLCARVHEAWSRVNRLLPPDYLATCSERLLLEQRRYQKRELLDASWIRALLGGAGIPAPIPVYLPASLEKRLPLFRRFPARLLGELVWQQDQYESQPFAIRALALGRVSTRARTRPVKAVRGR